MRRVRSFQFQGSSPRAARHVLIQNCHRRFLTPEVSGCAVGDASPPTCIPRPSSPQRGARRQPGVERSGTLGHPTPWHLAPTGRTVTTRTLFRVPFQGTENVGWRGPRGSTRGFHRLPLRGKQVGTGIWHPATQTEKSPVPLQEPGFKLETSNLKLSPPQRRRRAICLSISDARSTSPRPPDLRAWT